MYDKGNKSIFKPTFFLLKNFHMPYLQIVPFCSILLVFILFGIVLLCHNVFACLRLTGKYAHVLLKKRCGIWGRGCIIRRCYLIVCTLLICAYFVYFFLRDCEKRYTKYAQIYSRKSGAKVQKFFFSIETFGQKNYFSICLPCLDNNFEGQDYNEGGILVEGKGVRSYAETLNTELLILPLIIN